MRKPKQPNQNTQTIISTTAKKKDESRFLPVILSGSILTVCVSGIQWLFTSFANSSIRDQIDSLNNQIDVLKSNNPNFTVPSVDPITVPLWVPLFSVLLFILVTFIVTGFVLYCYPKYHNDHYSNPSGCQARIDAIPTSIPVDCSGCEKLHNECCLAIARINSEAEKQEKDVVRVQAVLNDALQLESEYRKAIQDQMVNNDRLAEIEKSVVSGEIYVMTSKFILELEEPMRGALIDNLNQGVKYCYIIPNNLTAKFKNMVIEIIKDPRLNSRMKSKGVNDFLVASPIPKEQIMPTIAYYPLPDNESEVIIKLPSDKKSAQDRKAYSSYRVPKSNRGDDNQYYEHKPFFESLSTLFENVPTGNRICPTIGDARGI